MIIAVFFVPVTPCCRRPCLKISRPYVLLLKRNPRPYIDV